MVTATREERLTLRLRGGNRELFAARDEEILAEGPAGTGKTRTILELLNLLCHTYAGLQVLMVRKTQVSMASSCIKEFKQHVLHAGDRVVFFGGSKDEPAAFRYPNGSSITVGGMDKTEKILSSFYDLIYFNEATEGTVDDWETLTTRLRGSEPGHEPRHRDTGEPFRHRRIIGDCNPTVSSHWLSKRTDQGLTRLIRSRLEDNPAYYNADGSLTEAGEQYERTLSRLTGVRYARFKLGQRTGVQGIIYDNWDRSRHLTFFRQGVEWVGGAVGMDYGGVHPSTVVAVTRDATNRLWVRAAWAGDGRTGPWLSKAREYCVEYGIPRTRIRIDPTQGSIAEAYGLKVAEKGAGSRNQRIGLVKDLLDGGLFLDFTGPGVLELADEIEMYHWAKNPDGTLKDEPDRIGEDRVAALEYAIEELEGVRRANYSAPLALQGRSSFGRVARADW